MKGTFRGGRISGCPRRGYRCSPRSRVILPALLALTMGLLQGCILWHYSFDSGLERETPQVTSGGVTLRWKPKVDRVYSRLPGGSTFWEGGEYQNTTVEDLRYDVQVFQRVPVTPIPKGADNDVEREVKFKLVHFRQGIRETQYTLPGDLARGATYAWRVRPVYRYQGQTVAEDWTRENSGWFFAIIGPASGSSNTTTTRPPEFTLP